MNRETSSTTPPRPVASRPRAARVLAALLGLVGALGFGAPRAAATPTLLMDMPSGMVLYEDDATRPWFPASLTKMMTVYVALKAVRDGRMSLQTPLRVTARAAAMPPSKMGFRPGTMVSLDTALKILMVKSANDVSVTVAEGVSGSVEAFADEMNAAAASLGMRSSHFANPNGLPNPQHYSSARDMALLARALYLTFPEQAGLFSIGALELGGKVMNNHNNLLGRYPGTDGMKTGFTCAAGFNVAATATQGGRKLIAVVLGAPTVALRTVRAAALFDRGFAGVDRPMAPISALPAQGGAPPDIGASVCRNRGPAMAAYAAENERLIAPLEAASAQAFASQQSYSYYDASALSRLSPMATRIALVPRPNFDPVSIRVAGYAGAESAGSEAEDDAPAAAPTIAPRPAAKAQPAVKARAAATSHAHAHARPVPPARALAAKTKVVADDEDDDAPKAKGQGKHGARHAAKPARAAAHKAEPAQGKHAAKPAKGKPAEAKADAKPTKAAQAGRKSQATAVQ